MSGSTRVEEARWRAGPANELVWSELGTDYVAYHRPSGRTHFFNAATAVLLEHVLAVPRTAAAAADELAAREHAAIDADFVAAVADSLAHLASLGLIEPCGS
jgi:PqqD family protein of HPr-rel-A system